MNRPLYLKPLALLIASLPLAAWAQEATLQSVTVSALKVVLQPATSTTVGEKALAPMRAATSDTASLLKDIPGVSLYGAGGVSSLPAIHGLADDRLRIKVDGMDLISACANHMNPALSYIDPSNVGSIKVFAGISPVSVGGDSIGGSIQVNSAAPEFAKAGQGTLTKGQIGAFYRSNGSASGGNLSATIAGENVSLSYNGSSSESGNYKAAKDFKSAGAAALDKPLHWLAGNEVGSSMYKSVNHSLGLALRQENHLVELKLGLQDMPYQGFPNQRMDMTGNDSKQINLRYTGQYEWGVLEARLYDEKTRHAMNFFDDKHYWYGAGGVVGTWPGMPMDTSGKNTGASVKADILYSARDTFRVGGEVQRYSLNDWWLPSGNGGMSPNTFWNINNGQRDRVGLFGEWEARWNAQWLTLLGLRGEKVDMNTGTVQGYNTGATYLAEARAFNARDHKRSDQNWDLAAVARYKPDATQTFEFGLAQKTRSPNLYERFAWSTGGMAMRMVNFAGDGNGYVGNLDLKPETARTLSATADWHDAAQETWGLKLTPYYTWIQDYIDAGRCVTANCLAANAANRTATTGFVYLQFVNQSARIYGLDVSGFLPLVRSSAYGSFTASGVLSYTSGKNQSTGDNLYNIMPLNAKLSVVQKLGSWTNTVEVQLVDAKSQVSQVRNELRTGAYGLLHLRSSYEWKQARVDLGMENALNKFYNLPLGGAYTGQGTTMPGTLVPWGIPVPGMGRSLYAGVNLKY